jgi:hypothetical protein
MILHVVVALGADNIFNISTPVSDTAVNFEE